MANNMSEMTRPFCALTKPDFLCLLVYNHTGF